MLEIYFDDLTEEAQRKVLDFYDVGDGDGINDYDPIFVLEKEHWIDPGAGIDLIARTHCYYHEYAHGKEVKKKLEDSCISENVRNS